MSYIFLVNYNWEKVIFVLENIIFLFIFLNINIKYLENIYYYMLYFFYFINGSSYKCIYKI